MSFFAFFLVLLQVFFANVSFAHDPKENLESSSRNCEVLLQNPQTDQAVYDEIFTKKLELQKSETESTTLADQRVHFFKQAVKSIGQLLRNSFEGMFRDTNQIFSSKISDSQIESRIAELRKSSALYPEIPYFTTYASDLLGLCDSELRWFFGISNGKTDYTQEFGELAPYRTAILEKIPVHDREAYFTFFEGRLKKFTGNYPGGARDMDRLLTKKFQYFSENYKTFLTASDAELPVLEETFGKRFSKKAALVTPVGEYGPLVAEAMIRTTQFLIEFAGQNLRNQSLQTVLHNSLLIDLETARGYAPLGEKLPAMYAPLATFIEGIFSLNQSLSILISNKVYDSKGNLIPAEELVRLALLGTAKNTGLVNQVSSRFIMGISGPTVLAGRHFPHPVQKHKDGSLVLSPKFIAALTDIRKERMNTHESMQWPDGNAEPGVPGHGCPFARFFSGSRDKTGIQILADQYYRVFSLAWKHRQTHP